MSESDEGVKITDNRESDSESGDSLVSGVADAAPDTAPVEAEQAADPIAELTADLQRVQAEFSNYRKRVERDREAVRDAVVAKTLSELLPVLDDIGRARSHSELEGGFKSVGEALEATVARLGLVAFGQPGDEFDPMRHEAIAHEHSADVQTSTCVAVFQPGYEFAGQVIRAAIVSVADPASE